jgi:hypothetical protein
MLKMSFSRLIPTIRIALSTILLKSERKTLFQEPKPESNERIVTVSMLTEGLGLITAAQRERKRERERERNVEGTVTNEQ